MPCFQDLGKLSAVTLFHIFWIMYPKSLNVESESLLRRTSKGVEYLVEASAAEAEAITATLAAAKARQVNGEVELPERDRGAEATPSGKQISTLIKPDSAVSNSIAPGVRLHHRAVSVYFY